MLKILGLLLLVVAITIMLCAVFYTGWIFVMTSDYWLSQVLGAALLGITFLLVTLAFMLVRISADGNN